MYHGYCRASLETAAKEGTNVTYQNVRVLVETDERFLYVSAILIVVTVVTALAQGWAFFTLTRKAGGTLHSEMFERVLRAPLTFFETNPLGRILNRFTRDTNFMDVMFPRNVAIVLMYYSQITVILILVMVVKYWLALAVIPMAVMLVLLKNYAMCTIRDLKRLDAISRTPLYTTLMDTLTGLPVIRALRRELYFEEQFHVQQDTNTIIWFLYFNSHRWLSILIEWLMVTMTVVVLVSAVTAGSWKDDSAEVGLVLIYITLVLGCLHYMARHSAEVDSLMTSVERICEYRELAQEAAAHTEVRAPDDWPSQGHISMRGVSLHYNDVQKGDEQTALKDINLEIKPKEKIGIVGRTGAGKSSIMVSLLRLVEPDGTILIDGLDVGTIGLHELRQSMAVIPQDPVLLCGTLRKNLDPFSNYTDADILQVLSQVRMKDAVCEMSGALYTEVSESGCNFSVGQKQLLCLARALLRKSKILLVDEATANVDTRTDALIQNTIREKFRDSTVLTIAHRLHTVMDSNRILVMSKGTVQEFDHPFILLQRPDSHLRSLVEETGPLERQLLEAIARTAYDNCNTSEPRMEIKQKRINDKENTLKAEKLASSAS